MTRIVDVPPSGPVDLADCLDELHGCLDPADPDSLLASAPLLRALGADPLLIVRRLNDALGDLASWQLGNRYAAPVLLLGSGPGWTVRANIWSPAERNEAALHSYELPHDHNFSFLTVGHLGPGYRTEIWEYDHRPGLTAGDRVDLTPVEETSLPTGRLMHYRASRDVHVQHPAPATSVSLNLLVHTPEEQAREQFLFDTAGGTVLGTAVERHRTGQHLLCAVAGHIGDGNTADVLNDIATTHPLPTLRATAREAVDRLTEPGRTQLPSAVSVPGTGFQGTVHRAPEGR
ncbi:hypothetical protein [Streptomyces sp. NPDC002640]